MPRKNEENIQVFPDTPPLWYSTGAVCASKGYTRCFGRTSLYLCASSLPNLAVLQDFIPLSVSFWNGLDDPVFDGVGLACFKSRANAFLLA